MAEDKKTSQAADPQSTLTAEMTPYSVETGLYQYYSSQAKALLAQYENINQLLGPTDDYTAPGTLCEILVRDFLRRNLSTMYSVDKGFIFGRRKKEDVEVHSPEICWQLYQNVRELVTLPPLPWQREDNSVEAEQPRLF